VVAAWNHSKGTRLKSLKSVAAHNQNESPAKLGTDREVPSSGRTGFPFVLRSQPFTSGAQGVVRDGVGDGTLRAFSLPRKGSSDTEAGDVVRGDAQVLQGTDTASKNGRLVACYRSEKVAKKKKGTLNE